MSICNASIGPRTALVAVDTRSLNSRHGEAETSKLMVLPHLAAVFAGRGVVEAITVLASRLATLPLDYDRAGELVPALARECCAALDPMTGADAGQWFALVGWSPRHGRLVGWQFHRATGFAQAPMRGGGVLAPALPGWGDSPPAIEDQATMIAVARAQVAYGRSFESERGSAARAFGGRLLIAEIDARGPRPRITVIDAADLDEPEHDRRISVDAGTRLVLPEGASPGRGAQRSVVAALDADAAA